MKRLNDIILRIIIGTLLALGAGLSMPAVSAAAQKDADSQTDNGMQDEISKLQRESTPIVGGSVLEIRDGKTICRAASRQEAQEMMRDPGRQLRVISDQGSSLQEQPRTGLKIILRGTPQLEQFPEAKAAFLLAARQWERLIQNRITVVIDVDFGPTAFGDPFRENQYGVTDFQRVFHPNAYPVIRASLIASAGSPREAALYNSLPADQLPTDLGAATGMVYHIAPMRALGLFPPVADPDGEMESLGMPPSIGFNSAIEFDFDPSDGIKPTRLDFNAAVMHEIGHALGFFSGVGLNELYPEYPLLPEMLDIFRFRPGVTTATFPTAPRILSSGGDHVYFGGGSELPFSTGRDDHTGGDGQQAGHWKDHLLAGRLIGIMNPNFSEGLQYEIAASDLEAFERIGYRMNPLPGEVELQIDDGLVEVGARDNGLMVVNRLTPPGYPATLRKLRILIGAAKNQPNPAGQPITLLIYTPNDSNARFPTGAQFRRIETVVPSASTELFIEFPIDDGPTIDSGDFYVGYQAPSPNQGVGFAVDLSGSGENRSFFSNNNGAGFSPLSDIYPGQTASAMIRAVVSGSWNQPAGRVVSVSAANFSEGLASYSIASAFGERLATTVMEAPPPDVSIPCYYPLPKELAGTVVLVRDSAGKEQAALIFFVSPKQVNYMVPPDMAEGKATVTIRSGDGTVSTGTMRISAVAPGLFSANGDGQGPPAGVAIRVKRPVNEMSFEEVVRYDPAQGRFVPRPLDLGSTTEDLFLAIYGTGLRNHGGAAMLSASIDGVYVPVLHAGPQPCMAGLDQVNLALPRSLIGRGEVDLVLTVNGIAANKVRINIK
ncbi:MAG: NF038122 family metalloprotease [Acidobacteriota bacterium]|nr:MAG: NF038122 family metalloprotease [Acidobacteriota bacterium]